MSRKKPKTYTTVECMVRDIRRGTHESGVFFLARVIRAVRRERISEVRRLRMALRECRIEFEEVSAMCDGKHRVACLCFIDYIDAALAPRRGKK